MKEIMSVRISNPLRGLVSAFGDDQLRRVSQITQVPEKNIRMIHFYLRRDASLNPVLHSLYASLFFKIQKFGDFRRAAQVFD